MYTNLVNSFCTPPYYELTDFDLKSISKSQKKEINFEGNRLPVYTWGKGKTILLIHGWGSRASHFAIMVKIFVNAGFRVAAFDAPAHSSDKPQSAKATSNMFEFGRALSSVAGELGEIHTILGHSIGAAVAAFVVSGFLKMEEYSVSCKKLVLISSPSSVDSIIQHFSIKNNLSSSEIIKLKTELEKEFDFILSDYSVGRALNNNPVDLMLVHDEDDNEFSISHLHKIHKNCKTAVLEITKSYGHQKILFKRNLLEKIAQFILLT